MEVKLTVVVFIAMTLMVNVVVADFFYNHPYPKQEEVHDYQYKCVPGSTTIKVNAKPQPLTVQEETDSEEYRLRSRTRKHHMTAPTKDESCQMCVCSSEGKDEYCSNRPAETIHECLLMKGITNRFDMGLPYEHEKSLAFRMRRDYIWHNDEIPYSSKAKCFRGHSYYTNSLTANDTDVDVGTDVESLLDYPNESTCFFCVCATSGEDVRCIHRDVAFCNFYRVIRSEKAVRDRYTSYLEQDRPAYFRQLSFRLRRTMDNGIFDMLDAVSHVGDAPSKKKCVPFISEYTNCNEGNLCSGCSRCKCDGDGQWACEEVHVCPEQDEVIKPSAGVVEENEEEAIFDNALNMLEFNFMKKKNKNIMVSSNPSVPAPHRSIEEDELLAPFHKQMKLDELFFVHKSLRPRRSITDKNSKDSKRSVDKSSYAGKDSSHNKTVNNIDAIDEINEDTLKDNLTGTLVAKKVDMIPPLTGSRRSGFVDTTSKALQIEYSQPKTYNQITDNKIEEQDNTFDSSHENLKTVLGNYTQNTKNNDISKIVVNELKKGSETIGDASVTPMSNITFTPENDTLTAMAFIAGNLLNKLWNMEKDASASSSETDVLKHEKISDLLELFKEPLNLRQETFLKNALQQLSSAIDKNKDAKNISICETINEKLLFNATSSKDEETTTNLPCRKKATEDDIMEPKKSAEDTDVIQKKAKVEMEINQKEATMKAIAKINNVVDLIKKFEYIQGKLSELQHGPKLVFNQTDTNITEDEANSFNMFGTLLEKITKLLLPKRNSKKITNVIKNQNFLKGSDNLKKKFEKLYNVDLTNMTVSAKDKLILDYLSHVDNNPDCLLKNKNRDIEALPSIGGNILLNLSEFFKLKSFSDLIKLLEPEKSRTQDSSQEAPNKTEKQTFETTTKGIEIKSKSSSNKGVDSLKFNSTKEKLKAHLKTIMEDLIEIQSARGISFKGNIKVSDALPCIYNLLKSDTEDIVKKEENIDPVKKIAHIFQGLKKELKTSLSRRNTGIQLTERPKSAVVWERLVKNLVAKSPAMSRRSSKSKIPKSYKVIKEMMEGIENGSSLYKTQAIKTNTAPAKKLIVLQALEQEVKTALNIIDEITLSFSNIAKRPTEQFTELEEFVGNLETRLKLSVKVIENFKSNQRKLLSEMNSSDKMSKSKPKKILNFRARDPREETDEMKISRIHIVNQLIRNRVETYIKLKDRSGGDVKNDMIYNIAQRIRLYLDIGDYKLASELFRFFVMQKQDDSANDKFIVSSTPKLIEQPMRRMAQPLMKAPVLLEDPKEIKAKHMNWVTQDHLIKQLLNIKNMGL